MERGDRVFKMIGVVEQGSEVPPAFFPIGAQVYCGAVVEDSIVDAAGIACGGGVG